MVTRNTLLAYTNEYLNISQFQDYCPNGLQVEGKPDIRRMISGVTASHLLIDAAINHQADLILVHHGYFWKGESSCITGIKRERIAHLLRHDINLLAYHLPLDAHAEVGNNVQLAKRLDIQVVGSLSTHSSAALGCYGELKTPLSVSAFAHVLQQRLNRAPQVIAAGTKPIATVAWCTGAAQNFITDAVALGADAYISGEISEPTVHIARECNIHYFSAGHHATERYGVWALGNHLAQRFGIEHQFIDIDNPV